MVLAQFKDGVITSKEISDALQIPRGDASVRGKVSNVLFELRKNKVIRTAAGSAGGSLPRTNLSHKSRQRNFSFLSGENSSRRLLR